MKNYKDIFFYFSLTFLCLWSLVSKAQEIGLPFVHSYPKEVYQFGTQNWGMEQSDEGLMYFANNDGLLEFDGMNWSLFPLPNKTVLRSVKFINGRIYAGGQNEFGYYSKDVKNKWVFKSLKSVLPEAHQSFEDVWSIEAIGDKIYFLASDKIYEIIGDQESRILDSNPISTLSAVDTLLIALDKQGTLFKIDDKGFHLLSEYGQFGNDEIKDVTRSNGKIYIATFKQGIFQYNDNRAWRKWPKEEASWLKGKYISSLTSLKNGKLAIGLSFDGLAVSDTTGKLQYLMNYQRGLPSDGIICSTLDRYGHLWLGLENGIAMLETNSPFKLINPVPGKPEAGYAVKIFQDQIYLGTNSGLYSAKWAPNEEVERLQLLAGSNGQIWGLDIIDDQLYLAHQEGAFLIDQEKLSPIPDSEPCWAFIQDRHHKQQIVSGTYHGVFRLDQDRKNPPQQLGSFKEASRFLEQDQEGNFWVSHPYQGVFRISPQQAYAVQQIDTNAGLPSHLHNHLFKVNGQIIVCAEKGVFRFESSQRKFVRDEILEKYLGADLKTRRLVEAENGDLWFINEREVGYLKVLQNGIERSIEKIVFPNLKRLLNDGWEKIYPFNTNNVFITTINGFIHYNGNLNSEEKAYPVFLNSIQINKDSVLYPIDPQKERSFAAKNNTLSFNVGTLDYANNKQTLFQFWLEGFDKGWTTPSLSREKEYTQLPYRDYKLKVRAINSNGKTSEELIIPFNIKTPWYLSKYALLVYTLLGIGLLALIIYRQVIRVNALKNQVVRTETRSKAEIQRLETEKIQAELDHKKRELVSTTVHIAKKNETLQNLATQLQELQGKINEPKVSKQMQKLIHSLKKEERTDDGWEQLMYHFNEIHPGFFELLQNNYPLLTPKDLKLAAYLKMNLSTKDMATLMNVSIRGVEASRYRLRKKMNIGSEVNLNEFFMKY